MPWFAKCHLVLYKTKRATEAKSHGAQSICILKPFASLQKISWMWGVKHETFGEPIPATLPKLPFPKKGNHLRVLSCIFQFALTNTRHTSPVECLNIPTQMSLGWKIRCENVAKNGGKGGAPPDCPPLLTDGPPMASLFYWWDSTLCWGPTRHSGSWSKAVSFAHKLDSLHI